eukprot:438260-Alexandrium_andersonii.AAC.1
MRVGPLGHRGRIPSSPKGPKDPLRGSESTEFRSPALPETGAGGAALRVAPPAPSSAKGRLRIPAEAG